MVLKPYRNDERLCFQSFRMHQLYCSVGVDNLKKLEAFSSGFQKIGVRKDWLYRNGLL